jgi:glycosyltransferase involved in cell wall biosynthesis
MSAPAVSVVIPCRNEASHILKVLDRLHEQQFRDYEIIIVNSGSTDNTLELVNQWQAAHPTEPIRIANDPAHTIPSALNTGIRAARAAMIVRLDGHSLPALDYLEKATHLLARPDIAVTGGAIEVKPGAPGPIAQAIAIAVSTPLGAGDAVYRIGSSQAQEVDTVPFGCFRKALWEQLGGFNETLLTNEDYEFYVRVRMNGGHVYFDPALRCTYFARATYGELARQYWRYGWWKARMLLNYPRSLRWRQAIPLFWSVGGLVLAVTAFITGWYGLLIPWLVYGLALIFEAMRHNRAHYSESFYTVLAYGIIHFAWGWGCWSGWFLSVVGTAKT